MPLAPKFSAAQVAAAFVELVNEYGDIVSILKLQKVLDYSQGWNLAYKSWPLFAERVASVRMSPPVTRRKLLSIRPAPVPRADEVQGLV